LIIDACLDFQGKVCYFGVLVNKEDAGCLFATSSNYQCEISMDVPYPGEIKTFEFEILPNYFM